MAAAAKKKSVSPKKASVIKKAAAKKPAAKPSLRRSNISLLKLPHQSMMAQLTADNNNAPRLPPRLQAVIDRAELQEVIATFCRGIDRTDENLLRSIFHPDATVDLGPGVFQGTANDYVHWILSAMGQVRSSHHLAGNLRAEIDGDAALSECYFQAHFRLDKPTGREDLFMGGRFLDRMERRPAGVSGVWKIVHRKQVLDWVRTEGASDIFYHQNPDALWSYRTKTDPSYQMAQFPGSQSGGKLPAFLGRRYESKSIKF